MFSKARNVSVLTSLCILCVSALANISSHSREISATSMHSDLATEAKGVGSNQAPSDVLLVSLLPTGFEPSEVTHPAGKFLFGVNNRTGLDDLRFQLIDESGRPVGEKRMVKEKIWRKVIEPTAGRYVLRVVGHPSWRCELIIAP